MNSIITLGIAISTLGNRFDSLKRLIASSHLELRKASEFVIVVQLPTPQILNNIEVLCAEYNLGIPIKVIIDDSIGLSRSRNIAMKAISSKYAWLIDDDVVVCENAIDNIFSFISHNSFDVYCGRVLRLEDNLFYKNYNFGLKLNKLEILKVSSIEIILAMDFYRSSGVTFFEKIGLGTKMPGGEENIMLLELYRRGATICHIPVSLVKHPCEGRSLVHIWTTPGCMEARGFVARQYGFFFGSLLVLRWMIRAFHMGIPFRKTLQIFYGFIKNYSIFEC